MKKLSKLFVLVIAMSMALTVLGCSSSSKNADNYPDKNITMIVPFAAGGQVDLLARGLARYWGEELGATMIVENRDGASTQVGTALALSRDHEGYTIIFGSQTQLSSTILQQNAPYKIDDIAMINFQQIDSVCLTTNPGSQFKTLKDFIVYAKANPGKATVGVMYGGPQHLMLALLMDRLELDLKLINYDSGNDLRTAVLGNQVDVIASNISGDVALGNLAHVIGVDDDTPYPEDPSIPLINDVLKEYGVERIPILGADRFLAVSTKFKDNYPERFEKLVSNYKKVFESDEYQKFVKTSGLAAITKFYTPDEADTLNKDQHEVASQYIEVLQRN